MKTEDLKKLLQTEENHYNYELDDEVVVKAATFAKQAHSGAVDKMGLPYYTHPYRVCQMVKDKFGNSSLHTEKQINYACVLALLHDVLEDTEYTIDDIEIELGLTEEEKEDVQYGLYWLTHDKNNVPYSFYIKSIAEADIIYPAWVKYCDLLDNSSLDRVIITDGNFLTGDDLDRINKYLGSIRVLKKRIYSQDSGTFHCSEEDINNIDKFMSERLRKKFAETMPRYRD